MEDCICVAACDETEVWEETRVDSAEVEGAGC